MKFFVPLFGLLAIITIGQSVNLNGYKVYRARFGGKTQVTELFNEMFERFDKIWLKKGLYVDRDGIYAEIVVSPKDEQKFLDLLKELSIKWDFLYEINEDEKSTLTNAIPEDRVHYHDFKVYHIKFTTDEQFNVLLQLKDSSSDVMFWQLSRGQRYADIMVGPNYLSEFLRMLNKYGFSYEMQIDDVEETINNNMPRSVMSERKSYHGYKVYKVTFDTEEQFEILRKLQIESGTGGYSFWQLSHANKYADIMLAPIKITDFLNFLTENHFKYERVIEVEKNTPRTHETRKSYSGYKIYEVKFTTEEEFQILFEMFMSSGEYSDYNVLHLARAHQKAHVMVGPNKISKVLKFLDQKHLNYKCINEDVGESLNKNRKSKSIDRVSYKGYKVYRVTFTTEEQFEILHKMQMESGSSDYSFWQLCRVRKFADIMVAPTKITNLLEILDKFNLSYEVMIDDVEEHIKNHE